MKTTLRIKPKRSMTPLVTALFLLSLQQTSHADLTRLDDQHLADVTGQAPIYTSYIDPSASAMPADSASIP